MVWHEDEERIESKGARGNQGEASQHGWPVVGPQGRYRVLDQVPGLLNSKELTRLAHPTAYESRDQSERQREDERQPPPADLERMRALRDQECGCDSHTDAQAKGQRGGMPRREPTAVLTRCPFKDEYAGHTQLSASRQALSCAKQQQYDRGKHTNDRIARQKSDGRSSSSHQHNDGRKQLAVREDPPSDRRARRRRA